MMDASQVAQLCRIFSLGQPLADPEPVSGGLLHALWLLKTSQGSFAVKVLNPAIMHKPRIFESYRLSEQISARLAALGIPAVSALSVANDPLQTIGDSTVLVYKWLDGELLSSHAQEPDRAKRIGQVLGQIHSTHLEIPELDSPGWTHFVDDDWDMLTFHAADQNLSWAYPARSFMVRLSAWSRLYEQAAERLSQHLVLSHRDLNQKNVIWRDAFSPFLIDWEAAGLMNPAMELAATALSWSGQELGPPRKETFVALVRGYAEVAGTLTENALDAMHGVLGIWLGWLLFNMRRSLGELTSNPAERQLGIRETNATLPILRNLAEHAETWASWLETSLTIR